jgi:hypothetical protein
MPVKATIAALSIFAAMPLLAANAPMGSAPAGTPATKYCLRVGPVTGSLVETVQCWTREEWAEQDVDVETAWAKDGVRVLA